MQRTYLQLLDVEVGERRHDPLNDLPQRFNGQPGFLLEPDASICYPFGKLLLTEAELRVLRPSRPLPCLITGREDSLTQWAVDVSARVIEHCHADLAVLVIHSCLSEDLSTCPASRVIDVLGLSAQHSLSVLGEPGSAWVQALECAASLHIGEGAAQGVLMLAGEKWRPPFRRHFGDLFALSDAMAAVLLAPQPSVHSPCIELHGWSACAASIFPHWLHEPQAVDVAAWACAVETGLEQIEFSLGLDVSAGNRVVLGPELGLAADDLASWAPRLAGILGTQHRSPNLAGHFGACDPFVRLLSWATEACRSGQSAEVLAWSAGPGGDVGLLYGVLRT